VGDLIESLPPQVAQEVCADLEGSGPAKARKACDALQETLLAQPAVPAPAVGPAADGVIVDPLSPGGNASGGVLSDDEPAGRQVADDIDNADGIEVVDRPMTEIPPARGGIAGASVSAGADTTAGVSSDAQSAGMHSANDAVASGGADPLYSPVVETSPATSSTAGAPVSTGLGSGWGIPSDVEPTREQSAGDTDDADGTDLFYSPVAEVAPAAGGTAAEPNSCAVAATTSTLSGDDTQSCRSNAKRDKSERTRSIPPVAATASVVSTTAAISVTTSTSASTGIQPGAEPDTANSESSNPESSNAESSNAESNNAESDNAQSSSSQNSSSNSQGSNSQSGSADSSKGKAKGDQAKGDKGSKGKDGKKGSS
jgi:hypothetical protein